MEGCGERLHKAGEEDTSWTAVSFCNKTEDVVKREKSYAIDWKEVCNIFAKGMTFGTIKFLC